MIKVINVFYSPWINFSITTSEVTGNRSNIPKLPIVKIHRIVILLAFNMQKISATN